MKITEETISDNQISRTMSMGNLSYRQQPDKVILGPNEFRVGRIQPALSKQGSMKSLASFSTPNLYSHINDGYLSYSDTEV